MPVGKASRLRSAVDRTTKPPRQSAPPLRRLVRGHRLDPQHRAVQDAVMALARVASKERSDLSNFPAEAPWDTARGFAGDVHKLLAGSGWQPAQAPWTWVHRHNHDLRFTLDKRSGSWTGPKAVGHTLREGWRHHNFGLFVSGKRRDAAFARDNGITTASYDGRRVKAIQRFYKESPGKAMRILTGSTVSPMMRAVAAGDPSQGVCPWCRRVPGTLDHLAWQCDSPDLAALRPSAQPQDALQRRLFWPMGTRRLKTEDDLIFNWGVTLDGMILQHRYNLNF